MFTHKFPSLLECTNYLVSQTTTVFTTSPSTLSGLCATAIEYPGAYSLFPSGRVVYATVTAIPVQLSNAYDCCNRCINFNDGFRSLNCVAYFNVPGVSCNLLYADIFLTGDCKAIGNAGVNVATSSVPNNLGGRGPCANTIAVTAT